MFTLYASAHIIVTVGSIYLPGNKLFTLAARVRCVRGKMVGSCMTAWPSVW